MGTPARQGLCAMCRCCQEIDTLSIWKLSENSFGGGFFPLSSFLPSRTVCCEAFCWRLIFLAEPHYSSIVKQDSTYQEGNGHLILFNMFNFSGMNCPSPKSCPALDLSSSIVNSGSLLSGSENTSASSRKMSSPWWKLIIFLCENISKNLCFQ